MRSSLRHFLFSAMFLLAAAYGQVSARVVGSVVDATGAVVPQASVVLQRPGSSAGVYSSVTGAEGDFTIPSVNPGTYTLVIEAKGFAKVVMNEVVVNTNRTTELPGLKLEVASVEQTVEVTSAQNDTVQLANAEVSNTITNTQLQRLPVINRQVLGFLATQAGVNSNPRGNTTIKASAPLSPTSWWTASIFKTTCSAITISISRPTA